MKFDMVYNGFHMAVPEKIFAGLQRKQTGKDF